MEIRALQSRTGYPDGMSRLRQFVSEAPAPAVRFTLCGGLRVHIPEDLNLYQEWIQSRGGFGTTDAFAEMESANGRRFGEAFCLRIEEARPKPAIGTGSAALSRTGRAILGRRLHLPGATILGERCAEGGGTLDIRPAGTSSALRVAMVTRLTGD